MAYTRKNLLQRIEEIQEFAQQFYEPGRQDRSWVWVWRNRVYPAYHISFRTFQTYLAMDVKEELKKLSGEDQSNEDTFKQLSLFE